MADKEEGVSVKVNRAESHISQVLSTDRAGSCLALSMVLAE